MSEHRARVAKILKEASSVYISKNKDYGDSYVVTTDVMNVLVPDMSLVKTKYQKIILNILMVVVGKLCRIANLTFSDKEPEVADEKLADTWRDVCVYGAMMSELSERKNEVNSESAQV